MSNRNCIIIALISLTLFGTLVGCGGTATPDADSSMPGSTSDNVTSGSASESASSDGSSDITVPNSSSATDSETSNSNNTKATTTRSAKTTEAPKDTATTSSRTDTTVPPTSATVREFQFKTGKGGKKITIGQISDAHISTVNAADMLDEEIADTVNHRKWGSNGMFVPAFSSALEYCKNFDRIILTGDILDFYSSGSAETVSSFFKKNTNIRACLGGHETTLEMETGRPNKRPLSERYELVQKFWPNDVHYFSETLGDKVTIIALDNNTELWMGDSREMFDEAQYESLSKDIAAARSNGRIILMFMHEPMYSGVTDSVTDIYTGEALTLRTRLPRNGTVSRKTYDLITSSSDVISGVFFGHLHMDFDMEIAAGYQKGDTFIKKNIPAHCLTSNAYGEGGHIIKITVD